MKTISLTTNNRLESLKRTIASLRENDLTGYSLFIGCEPSNADVIAYCQSLDFIPTSVVVNESQLGISPNTFQTVSRAFDSGSEFNISIEDDIFLAKDAIRMADFFNEKCEADCLILHQPFDFEDGLTGGFKFILTFQALAWAMRREQWNLVSTQRNNESDFVREMKLRLRSKRVIQPQRNRCQHQGIEAGTNYPAHGNNRPMIEFAGDYIAPVYKLTDYRPVQNVHRVTAPAKSNKADMAAARLLSQRRGYNPPIESGAGTELKKLLKKIGIVPSANCSCNAKAVIMNDKGADWCYENVDTIVGWLRDEHQRQKIKLPFTELGAKLLVKHAIRRARKLT